MTLPGVQPLYVVMEELMAKYPNLLATNLCNLDETNLTPERRKTKVLVRRGARRTHTLCNDARFNMTILHVVFDNGSWMPPHLIVKGKRRPVWWGEDSYQQILRF